MAWHCCHRIVSDAHRVDLGAAAHVAVDLGNTTLGAFCISGRRDDSGIGNILVPPLEKFHQCFLCPRHSIGLEKVGDKLVEFLVGGACKVEM